MTESDPSDTTEPASDGPAPSNPSTPGVPTTDPVNGDGAHSEPPGPVAGLPAPPGTRDDGRGSPVSRLFSAASLLAIGNIASRVLGFLRTRTITTLFGLELETDAFLAASKVPTGLYNLLIGGQLSAALVPVLSDYASRDRRAGLWQAASVLATAAAAALATCAIAVGLGAPYIARFLTPDYGPEGVAMVADALRIMAPAIVVFGLAGVVTGLLLALERFTLPALAGAVYNAVMIGTILVFDESLGARAMPLGVLCGSLGQLALLLPGARDVRLRPLGRFRHPALRRVLILYAPIAAGLLVTDIALPLLDVRLAAAAGEAARSTLDVATQLTQFPHGLIAVAISMAILPSLSGAHARGEDRTFARTLARGARMVIALSIPAAIGLAALSEPVVGAVFQAGAFDASDRVSVALALSIYLLGLPFAAIDWPMNYAFYARQRTWVPALVGLVSVGAWLAVAIPLGPPMDIADLSEGRGFVALALADSAKHIMHASIMVVLVARTMGTGALRGLPRTTLAALVSGTVMGLAVWNVDALIATRLAAGPSAFLIRSVAGSALGAAIYLPLAARLGVQEIGWLIGIVGQRFRGAD